MVDDHLFVLGGKAGVVTCNGQPDTLSANASPDGALGARTAVTPLLPEGRTSLAVTLAGDFLYATGGGFDAGGLPTVFAARVRFTP